VRAAFVQMCGPDGPPGAPLPEMRLTGEDVSAALLSLRRQTREDVRWWSVIDEREIAPPFVACASEELSWI